MLPSRFSFGIWSCVLRRSTSRVQPLFSFNQTSPFHFQALIPFLHFIPFRKSNLFVFRLLWFIHVILKPKFLEFWVQSSLDTVDCKFCTVNLSRRFWMWIVLRSIKLYFFIVKFVVSLLKMIPVGGITCCLSAAALYLLGRSSGRFT